MTYQKVLPIMQLVTFAVIIFYCLGFSDAVTKENIKVMYTLLILKILIFNIVKCNI